MAPAPSSTLSIFFLSLLFPSATSFHIPLDHHVNPELSALVATSLARAHRLKNPNHGAPSSTLPLLSHAYGGHTVSLGFGTPPQRIPLIVDTGSSLVWLPCTRSFLCKNCSSPPFFSPKSSSSAKLVGCRNPKCRWIHSPELLSSCRNGTVCPPYLLLYASASTGGLLLAENLDISPPVSDFAVGCSLFSAGLPAAGVAGFGRGPAALPSQLKLRRFSHCLAAGGRGSLVLDPPPPSSFEGFSFTPFLKNPSEFYHLRLREITVDGRKVKKVRRRRGGAVIDSGTTFTYMEEGIFRAVEGAVVAAAARRYNRSAAAEEKTGLRVCFAAAGRRLRGLPRLGFRFRGGAMMRLPVESCFVDTGEEGAACLALVAEAGEGIGGPSLVLGSFQQKNFNVVYDLEKKRLGFRRQSCLHKKN